jgi:hypothetical protein
MGRSTANKSAVRLCEVVVPDREITDYTDASRLLRAYTTSFGEGEIQLFGYNNRDSAGRELSTSRKQLACIRVICDPRFWDTLTIPPHIRAIPTPG